MVDLLRELQRKRDLTYMFISHDLRVVASLASHLIVMRHGKVVEEGPPPSCSRIRRATTPAPCSPPRSGSRRSRSRKSGPRAGATTTVVIPAKAGDPVRRGSRFDNRRLWILVTRLRG
jgi:ABC-type glutathione transport system ATPase component